MTDAEQLLLSSYTSQITVRASAVDRDEPVAVDRARRIQAAIDAGYIEYDTMHKGLLTYSLTHEGIQHRRSLKGAAS